MSPRLRSLLIQLGFALLAIVLLYVALRGVDFREIGEALKTADYRWLLPLAVITILSHLLRAWRWLLLMEALPPSGDTPTAEAPAETPRKLSLKIAFYSLMIGYMINYVASRVGEVVRTANMARQERLAFSGVLGTVFVDRILDMAVLLLGLVSVVFLLLERQEILNDLLIAPLQQALAAVPLGLTLGSLLLLVAASWWGIRFLRRAQHPFAVRLRSALGSFKAGLLTVARSRRKPALLLSTIGIWLCYTVMTYLPFLIFGIEGLTLADAWVVMLLGAVGIAIPSPGGAGTYHAIVIETLVRLFDVGRAAAASYAIFAHASSMLLYILVGALCLLLQGTSMGALKASALEARAEAQDRP